jgi:deoxyribodipyrimidine photolyase-like uncharacterized protein
LVGNLRRNSNLALFNIVFLNIRRLTMLYLAMFVTEMPWVQVISFTLMNLLAVAYLLHTKPFEDSFTNILNLGNELSSLFVSYCVMAINGIS